MLLRQLFFKVAVARVELGHVLLISGSLRRRIRVTGLGFLNSRLLHLVQHRLTLIQVALVEAEDVARHHLVANFALNLDVLAAVFKM